MQRMLVLALGMCASLSAFGQGILLFQNVGNGVDAPVFDLDGTTRLNGTNGFVAQLYAGADLSNLAPVGSPVPFSTNGYFFGGLLTVPNVPPGAAAAMQVRVWRLPDGATFERALNWNGAHWGVSSRFYAQLNSASFPGYLVGLQSFNLTTTTQFSTRGEIWLGNSGHGIDAPVFDVDGVTPLAGTNFLAQLYAGFDATNLAPVGVPVTFTTNGYFGEEIVSVPNLFPSPTAIVQVKAWRASDGVTYEQAKATVGAHLGASQAFETTVSLNNYSPAYLTGLQRFNLRVNQGTILFQNVGNGVDAPVFDADGATRLSGTSFLAQLYVGPTTATLTPIGDPVSFTTNGYFFGGVLTVPDMPADGTVMVQVRAWNASSGATFEGASLRAAAHLGVSDVFTVTLGADVSSPGYLTGLERFLLTLSSLSGYVERIDFDNFDDGVDAPVFDHDGIAKLAGTNFLARLYIGSDLTNMTAIGSPVPFTNNGYFSGGLVAWSPLMPVRNPAVQVRVWLATDGASFEQAASTAGARVGASRRFHAPLDYWTHSPGYLTGLESFSLQTLAPASYTIQFANLGNGIDAPVFDLDGTTRLSGSNYVAQLYAGFDTNSLVPEGAPVRFTTNGYFQAALVSVQNVFPDPVAVVQVRVWRLSDGATFELARNTPAARWGFSAPFEVTLANRGQVSLAGLQSVSLSATPPLRLGTINRGSDGTVQLTVSGKPGQGLVVEYSGDLKTWSALATNSVGSNGQVQATDLGTPGSPVRFYRARTH